MYTHHKIDHEFPGGVTPTVSFAICSIPRCGSSLICELLAQTGHAGAPTEFFDQELMGRFSDAWGTATFDEYLVAMKSKKTSPNGVFGFKAHYHQLRAAFQDRDPLAEFPNLHFIYIKRLDHLRQAISWMRADQTGEWGSDYEATKEPWFDRAGVGHLLGWIKQDEDGWEAFFERRAIAPLRIVYEDLVESLEETVTNVMGFLGVPLPAGFRFAPPTLQRQADQLTEEWVRQYLTRPVHR